jgi:molybdate transport system regulatory protein
MTKHLQIPTRRGQHVPPNTVTLHVHTKVWLEHAGEFVLGEGGVALLRQIDQLGSLTQAAKAIGWSYRHAWGYVRHAERQLGVALVTTSPGKGARRGTMLSPAGREVARRVERACRSARRAATMQWRAERRDVRPR